MRTEEEIERQDQIDNTFTMWRKHEKKEETAAFEKMMQDKQDQEFKDHVAIAACARIEAESERLSKVIGLPISRASYAEAVGHGQSSGSGNLSREPPVSKGQLGRATLAGNPPLPKEQK